MTIPHVQLTVLLPVLNERENLALLLPRLTRVLGALGCAAEVVVVDGGSSDGTPAAARHHGVRVIGQQEPGYGGAMRAGFAVAAGQYVLTLDADLSHDPDFVVPLWAARERAEIVIASRYVAGGAAVMPLHRLVLSRTLNWLFAAGLGLPVRDLSSGFRLYRTSLVTQLELTGRNFEIVEEVLVKGCAAGWRVLEIPFRYHPRRHGASHARIVPFGLDLLRAFLRLRTLRPAIARQRRLGTFTTR